MLVFTRLLPAGDSSEVTLVLELDHEQRRHARLRLTLADGSAVGLQLGRAVVLEPGARLATADGSATALIRARAERLSRASSADTALLARAAYHLGNRHVALQLEPGRLSYPHDHVLDGLCRELGLEVREELAPFEPEPGGYGAHRHDARLAAAPREPRHG